MSNTLIELIKPNADETLTLTLTLTGILVHVPTSAREATMRLISRRIGIVAVQTGEHGNLLVWPDDEV